MWGFCHPHWVRISFTVWSLLNRIPGQNLLDQSIHFHFCSFLPVTTKCPFIRPPQRQCLSLGARRDECRWMLDKKGRKWLVTYAEAIVAQLHIKKKQTNSIDTLNIRLLWLEVPKQLQIMKGDWNPQSHISCSNSWASEQIFAEGRKSMSRMGVNDSGAFILFSVHQLLFIEASRLQLCLRCTSHNFGALWEISVLVMGRAPLSHGGLPHSRGDWWYALITKPKSRWCLSSWFLRALDYSTLSEETLSTSIIKQSN